MNRADAKPGTRVAWVDSFDGPFGTVLFLHGGAVYVAWDGDHDWAQRVVYQDLKLIALPAGDQS